MDREYKRIENELSEPDMAAYLDITANSYSRIERGEVKCDLPKLFIICQMLDISADYILFGKESAWIPEEIFVDNEDTCIRIPLNPEIRSLNLANSVAIILYEALRQNDFHGMQMEGHLHRLQWKE